MPPNYSLLVSKINSHVMQSISLLISLVKTIFLLNKKRYFLRRKSYFFEPLEMFSSRWFSWGWDEIFRDKSLKCFYGIKAYNFPNILFTIYFKFSSSDLNGIEWIHSILLKIIFEQNCHIFNWPNLKKLLWKLST